MYNLLVAIAGGVGGLVNLFFADNTFGISKSGFGGWVYAIVANFAIGMSASWLPWALYGPLNGCPIFACQRAQESLTLSGIATAVAVGIAGSRWVSAEVDKKLLQSAAAEAMGKQANLDIARRIGGAGTSEVVRMIRNA